METHRLTQFRVLVETGNLRKAAELLGISHSGLSKSMKTLERELGITLFLPSGRGVVISDQGSLIYERSKRFLAEYDLLRGASPNLSSTVLRLGSFEVFTSYFIGPLLKRYLQNPDVEIHELVPGRLEEALALKRIDIGITYEPVPRKGIEYIKVTSLLMGAFAAGDMFKELELAKIPFIVPVQPLEGAPSGVKGRDAWPDEKIERLIRYRVDLLSTGLEIARQGLAAIFIPRFLARLHNERVSVEQRLQALKLPRHVATIKRDVFLVKREASAEDRTARQIARALRDICSEEKD